MHSETLSTMYTLLANNTDNDADSSPNNSPYTLMEKFYDLLPSIAIIDADNYETHFEQLKNFTRHISQIMTDEAISKVSIGVGGGFSAGKSRFINTLIDMDVLPEALEPCTAVATYLTHNDNDTTQALNIFNTAVDVEQAQLKHLRHFIGDDSENSLHISQIIKHVTINTPQIKWQNITFLDTPGYSKADADDSIVNDENLALSQLNAVDHIVWLVSAKNGTIRDEDIQFLQRVNPQKPIFVVLTQADLVNQMDTDIPLIMQGIKDHLENNDIALAGIMAWAAPAYTEKGEHIAGDDICAWLDDLNDQQIETHLSQLIDYCEVLNLTAQHKLDDLDDNSDYDKALYKSISKGQEQIKDHKEAIIELVSKYRAFDWDLAEMYASEKIAGGIDKAIDIYKAKVPYDKDRAIDKLNSLVFKTHNIDCIQTLADIYDKQLDHPEAAAKYHRLILKKYFKSKQAEVSWQWLSNISKTNDTIFNELYSLVEQIDNPEYTYKFALLADELNHNEMSIELILNLAESYHLESLSYLESKAGKDESIKLRLGNIYKNSSSSLYQNKAIKILRELALSNNNEALNYLSELSKTNQKIGLLALITLANLYEEQFDELDKASKYHSLILKKHLETESANKSWKWLLNQAKTNDTVYKQLYDLINDLQIPEYTYEFALLADKLNHNEISIELLITLAETYHLESLSYLESKAKKDNSIKLRLGNIYKKSSSSFNQNKAIDFFKELALSNNQEALNNLIKLSKKNREIGLLALITLANLYEQQFDELDEAAKYHSIIVERHANLEYRDISIKWLLNYAEENRSVFDNLHKLVEKLNEAKLNYKFGILLDSLTTGEIVNNSKAKQMAVKFILKSAQEEYNPALNWLFLRSADNPDLKLQLALIYERSNSQNNRQKFLPIYKELAGKGNKQAIERLEVLAKNHDNNSNKAIKILADIFDTSDPSKASIYHQLIINRQPETQVAQQSWDWLFKNAIENETVFNTLKNLVNEHNSFDTNYKMLLLADTIQRDDIATDYAIINAMNGHVESKNWLFNKAKLDNHPAEDRIYSLYNASNKDDEVNNVIFEYLIQKIIKGNKLAFQRLKKLALHHKDYKAMWLLSICYTYGQGVNKNFAEAELYLKQAASHIEEAQYNLDVLHYLKIKKDNPFYWILLLSSDDSDPLFRNLGMKKYLINFGFIVPTFIGWNYETSYAYNTKAIIVYTVLFLIILSLMMFSL